MTREERYQLNLLIKNKDLGSIKLQEQSIINDKYNSELFLFACQENAFDIAYYLYEIGVDIQKRRVKIRKNYNAVQILLFTITKASEEFIAKLIHIGFKFEHPCFQFVCENNLEEIQNLYSQESSIINASDTLGYRMIDYACALNRYNIVLFLLENGVQLDTLSSNGQSGIHYAALNDCVDILKLAYDRQIDLSILDNESCPPLFFALMGSAVNTASYLIEMTDQLNFKDEKGLNALYYAVHLDDTMFKLCLASGINLEQCHDKNRHPIHEAAGKDNVHVLQLLYERGVSINLKDSAGFSPLEHALFHGSIKTVKYLLENNAELNLRNENFYKSECHNKPHLKYCYSLLVKERQLRQETFIVESRQLRQETSFVNLFANENNGQIPSLEKLTMFYITGSNMLLNKIKEMCRTYDMEVLEDMPLHQMLTETMEQLSTKYTNLNTSKLLGKKHYIYERVYSIINSLAKDDFLKGSYKNEIEAFLNKANEINKNLKIDEEIVKQGFDLCLRFISDDYYSGIHFRSKESKNFLNNLKSVKIEEKLDAIDQFIKQRLNTHYKRVRLLGIFGSYNLLSHYVEVKDEQAGKQRMLVEKKPSAKDTYRLVKCC